MRLEMLDQLVDRLGTIGARVVVMVEKLYESPLRPLVVLRIASYHLTAPVEAKANVVQLLTVTSDVDPRRLFRVAIRLDSVLLSWQAEGIVTHRMQHVVPLQTLIASVNVRSNVA